MELFMEMWLADDKDLPSILKYDRHIRPDRLEDCIRSRRVYVLLDGQKCVGVLRYSLFWQSIPFLDLLYLDEDYRDKGYGSRMMACWEDAMRAEKYPHVMLSTQADERAKFFYEKLGYRRIGAFLPPEQEADEIMYVKEFEAC